MTDKAKNYREPGTGRYAYWNDFDRLFENQTLDVVATDVVDGKSRATFYGIDWGLEGKSWTALTCPRCSARHQWHVRRPKRCRNCDLKFIYTASVPSQ